MKKSVLVIFAAMTLAFAGCGKKGPLKPAPDFTPAVTSGLAADPWFQEQREIRR